MKQLTHNEVVNSSVKKEIIVISESIRTPENVGMLFRISEAFGVKTIYLVGDSPNLENKKVLRTARSTEKELDIKIFDNSNQFLDDLKQQNFSLIGLELTDNSKSISNIDFSKVPKIALFIGAERFGIEDETLKQLDQIVHIDLFGKNSSINVVNALAIALFKLSDY